MPLTSRQKEDLKQGDHFSSFFIFKNKFLLEKGLISLHNNFSPDVSSLEDTKFSK